MKNIKEIFCSHTKNLVFFCFSHWQLLVGDFGLSYNQQKIQMSLWSIMASPLLVSADLRHITNKSKSILLNNLALNISQDPLGVMGTQIDNVSDCEQGLSRVHTECQGQDLRQMVPYPVPIQCYPLKQTLMALHVRCSKWSYKVGFPSKEFPLQSQAKHCTSFHCDTELKFPLFLLFSFNRRTKFEFGGSPFCLKEASLLPLFMKTSQADRTKYL